MGRQSSRHWMQPAEKDHKNDHKGPQKAKKQPRGTTTNDDRDHKKDPKDYKAFENRSIEFELAPATLLEMEREEKKTRKKEAKKKGRSKTGV